MPSVLRSGPYRLCFYASAKFWLQPVGLARDLGFSPKELRGIQRLVSQHQAKLLEAWHGYFGTGG